MTNRRGAILFTAACLIGMAGWKGPVQRDVGRASVPSAKIGGYYLGTSDSGECRCAWLLRLDGRGGGALYAPPGTVRIAAHRPRDRSFWFETDEEQVVRFEGTVGPDGLVGTVVRSNPGRSSVPAPLVLRRISRSLLAARTRAASTYSNAEYHTESGDRAGYDLVFVPLDGERSMVIATAYPNLSPQPAGEIRHGQGTVVIHAYDGIRVYRAVFRGASLVLEPAGGTGEQERAVLRRQTSTFDLLR